MQETIAQVAGQGDRTLICRTILHALCRAVTTLTTHLKGTDSIGISLNFPYSLSKQTTVWKSSLSHTWSSKSQKNYLKEYLRQWHIIQASIYTMQWQETDRKWEVHISSNLIINTSMISISKFLYIKLCKQCVCEFWSDGKTGDCEFTATCWTASNLFLWHYCWEGGSANRNLGLP